MNIVSQGLKRFLILFVSFVAIDQAIKYLIRHYDGFYICNKNIALGLKIIDSIFWVFWLLIIIFLLLSLYKRCFVHNTLYIILILAGAISNIIDRIFFGCVIDFIDLKFWPVFNLADIYITIGAIMIIINKAKHTA